MFADSLPEYPLLPVPQYIRYGAAIVPADSSGDTNFSITHRIVSEIAGVPADNDEAYSLTVLPDGINIEAISEKGLFWAQRTLEQLKSCSGGEMRECEIVDWPAFPWRGFMMDCGRSYISPEELKREIDIMSQFKLNVFHWHLTENQAWRLESRIFPQLTDSVNMERHRGKFYTIAEARELVEYARERNVLVVPEIDMPGHSAAFARTFGCDMQSPEGMEILKQLVDEACTTFDVPFMHIGTDEAAFTNPEFVPEMVKFVRERGKKAISWNPGWNYGPGEIDMTTMWSYRGRPTPGVPAVDMRFHYINHFDSYADLIALYRSNIYGHKKAEDDIIGVEIGLWNDRYVDDEASMIAQNSLYPALLAVAERAWRGGGEEYFDVLGTNLREDCVDDFKTFADFEKRLLWHKDNTLGDLIIPYVKQTDVRWLITDAFPNGGDLTAVFPPETEGLKESYVYKDSIYGTSPATGAAVYMRHVWGTLVPGFYADPQPDHTAYAFTWVYAPEDMTVGLQAETQNYSRSESDIPPPPGKWDFRESRIWVNDNEIQPPTWTANHTERSNEISLGNENFAARPPIAVDLRHGWNKVLIKLPVGSFRTPETRLVKWMFTFVFTTPDGRHAAPGLIYSPRRQL